MSRAIRHEYEKHGAAAYYGRFGAAYRNPHEPQVGRSLKYAVETWRLDLSRVLDLAAGSGEATLALRELGVPPENIDGVDPFTGAAYLARTGRGAERFTFEEVAAGVLAVRRYSLIVCSFALHLCEPSRLPAVAWQLGLIADSLLVLTPHKRPHLRAEWGWELTGEQVIERVRSRCYRKS